MTAPVKVCAVPDCGELRHVYRTGRVASGKCREHLTEQERVTGRKYRTSEVGRRNGTDRQRRYKERLGPAEVLGRERERRKRPDVRAARAAAKAIFRRTEKGRLEHRREQHKRRIAGLFPLLTVRVESDVCGICFGPLAEARYPHPMTTTLGHEPPLSVAVRDGWQIVTERPEHWACNLRKGVLTDAELVGIRR